MLKLFHNEFFRETKPLLQEYNKPHVSFQLGSDSLPSPLSTIKHITLMQLFPDRTPQRYLSLSPVEAACSLSTCHRLRTGAS